MTVYIIDFGLSIHIDSIDDIRHSNVGEAGTPGYLLSQLVDFKSPLIDKNCRQVFHDYSSSVFNDRVAMCKVIIELMMGHCYQKSFFSDSYWRNFNGKFVSWVEWFWDHEINQCVSNTLHHGTCRSLRNTWCIYSGLTKFLMHFANPLQYLDKAKDLKWWTQFFLQSIQYRPR